MDILNNDVMTILDLSLDGVFIENTHGDILQCNQAGADMFGYTKREISELNIRDLVPHKAGYYLKEKYTPDDLFPEDYIDRLNVKKDGTLILTEINSRIITLNDREYLIAFVRDAMHPARQDPGEPVYQTSAEVLKLTLKKEEKSNLILRDSVGRKKYVVSLKDVEYIEYYLRKLYTHLINGNVLDSHDSLDRIFRMIPANGSFLWCYQSYIINLQYAELDESTMVFLMRSGSRIPIRKKQYTNVKKIYYFYKYIL